MVLLGDMFQTFILELIAATISTSTNNCTYVAVSVSATNCTYVAVCPPAYCVAVAIVAIYVLNSILFAVLPGLIYVCKKKCDKDSALLSLYSFLGPILYYYGENITKVIDMVGVTPMFGCSDVCQSGLRASGAAMLFGFLLLNQLYSDWYHSKPDDWPWRELAMEMIVKLISLDAFYTAFIHVYVARSNITSTPMFCRTVDKGFVGTAVVITMIYGMSTICHSCYKAITFKGKGNSTNPSTIQQRMIGVSGTVVWFTFTAYLLVDNFLPLNFSLCDMLPEADRGLHIARAALSFVCLLSVSIIFLYFAIPSRRCHCRCHCTVCRCHCTVCKSEDQPALQVNQL